MSETKQLPLVSLKGKEGSEIRKTRDNNRILKEVRAEGDALAKLIAETRWLTLGLTQKQHAKAAGISYGAQTNAESAGTHPELNTYASIYRLWQNEEVFEAHLKRFLQYLQARRHEWRGEKVEDGEAPDYDLVDLYYEWMIRSGLDEFDQIASEVKENGKPFHDGSLWQRRASGMVPAFAEVKYLAEALEMDATQATEIWTREKMQQLEARGVPPAYREFLIRLERDKGMTMTAAGLSELSMTTDTQQKIARSEYVSFDAIADIAAEIFSANELTRIRRAWEQSAPVIAEKPSAAFARIRDARGLTNKKISYALDIRPPEERRDDFESQRKESYRPSHKIRGTWDNPSKSPQAPAGVLAGIVAPTDHPDASQNDPENNEYLQKLFWSTRERIYRGKGGRMDDMELRILREYWGVEPEDIADVAKLTPQKLLQAERGICRLTDDQRRKLMFVILKSGQTRIADARGRMEEAEQMRHAMPTCLDDFIPCMMRRVGGVAALYRAVSAQSEYYEGLSAETMKSFGTGPGKIVPPLATYRKIANACGLEDVPDHIVQEWHAVYPDFLHSRENEPVKNPLARGFETLVASHQPNLRQFQEYQMPSLSYPSITRNFQDLRSGDFPTWHSIGRYLNACDLSVHNPMFVYLKALHAKDGNLGKALCDWRSFAKRKRLDPARHEYKFGLTSHERKKFSVSLP